MITLDLVSKKIANPAVRVVFVHGLGGDSRTTWEHSAEHTWLSWLGEDHPTCEVWTLGYPAGPSAWKGSAMPLFDRATAALAMLKTNRIDSAPICFVTHSMGGLLVKHMLRLAASSPDLDSVGKATKAVMFIATPHQGSPWANFVQFFKSVLRTTVAISDLEHHAPQLRDLNQWYRTNAPLSGIITRALYETQPIKTGQLVVDADSANPMISGVTPVAIDADHLSICKPSSRAHLTYLIGSTLVEDLCARNRPSESNTGTHSVTRAGVDTTAVSASISLVTRLQQDGAFDVPQNNDTISRKRELAILSDAVRHSPIVIIEGISGVGKSYILAEYCRRRDFRKHPVLWYSPIEGETVDALIAELGDELFPPHANTVAQCKRLMRHLANAHATLVIDDFQRVDQESYKALCSAAAASGHPARLILATNQYSDSTGRPSGTTHVRIDGMSDDELRKQLNGRGLARLKESDFRRLRSATDGLPLASSLFSALISDFGVSVEELLGGSMVTEDRVRDWFGRLSARLSPVARNLLRALSLVATPFDMEIVRTMLDATTSSAADLRTLQTLFLVKSVGPKWWQVHALVGQMAIGELSPTERTLFHKKIADTLGAKIPGAKHSLSRREVKTFQRVCHHLQQAGDHELSSKLVERISRDAKAKGMYEGYMQLLAFEMANNPERSRWVDYNYAHCALILGRYRQTEIILKNFNDLNRPSDALGIYMLRLRVELELAVGQASTALQSARRLAAIAPNAGLSPNNLEHVQSVLTWTLIENGLLAEADGILTEFEIALSRRNSPLSRAVATTHRGFITWRTVGSEQALPFFSKSIALFGQIGDFRGLGWARASYALALAETGDMSRGESELQLGLHLRKESGECSREYLNYLNRWTQLEITSGARALLTSEIVRVEEFLR